MVMGPAHSGAGNLRIGLQVRWSSADKIEKKERASVRRGIARPFCLRLGVDRVVSHAHPCEAFVWTSAVQCRDPYHAWPTALSNLAHS